MLIEAPINLVKGEHKGDFYAEGALLFYSTMIPFRDGRENGEGHFHLT